MRPLVLGLVFVWATTSVSACARDSRPTPKSVSRVGEPAAPRAIERGPSEYEAEIGGLSQEDFEKEVHAAEPELRRCVDRAAGDMSYLGGRVSVRMRVDRAGSVRWAYLKETTLG